MVVYTARCLQVYNLGKYGPSLPFPVGCSLRGSPDGIRSIKHRVLICIAQAWHR